MALALVHHSVWPPGTGRAEHICVGGPNDRPITVGRHGSCDVVVFLDRGSVSRRHVEVQWANPTHFLVRDVSANGTWRWRDGRGWMKVPAGGGGYQEVGVSSAFGAGAWGWRVHLPRLAPWHRVRPARRIKEFAGLHPPHRSRPRTHPAPLFKRACFRSGPSPRSGLLFGGPGSDAAPPPPPARSDLQMAPLHTWAGCGRRDQGRGRFPAIWNDVFAGSARLDAPSGRGCWTPQLRI